MLLRGFAQILPLQKIPYFREGIFLDRSLDQPTTSFLESLAYLINDMLYKRVIGKDNCTFDLR